EGGDDPARSRDPEAAGSRTGSETRCRGRGEDVMSESIVTLTWDGIAWANIVAAFVLPILVGLVTKKFTKSVWKVLLLTTLNTAQSLLGEAIRTWQDGGTYDLGVALPSLVTALRVAWGACTSVWKPSAVTERAQRVGDKTALTGNAAPGVSGYSTPIHSTHAETAT